MRKKVKNNGISLIVLVITIIVIIILSTAVIVTVVTNNPIKNAKMAVITSDIASMQDAYSSYISNRIIEEGDIISGCGYITGGSKNKETTLTQDEAKYTESIENVALTDIGKVTVETIGIEGTNVASMALKNNKVLGMEIVEGTKVSYYMIDKNGNPKKISKESYLSLTSSNPSDKSDLDAAQNTIKDLQDQIEAIRNKLIEIIRSAGKEIEDNSSFENIYEKLEEIVTEGKNSNDSLIEIAKKVSSILNEDVPASKDAIIAGIDKIVKNYEKIVAAKNEEIEKLKQENKTNTETLVNISTSLTEFRKKIAETITKNGVETKEIDSKETMSSNIDKVAANKYNEGAAATKKGTANQAQVLAGYTFTSLNGVNLGGTMQNRGKLNWNPSTSTSYTLPEGYYKGGTISTTNAYNSGYSSGYSDGNSKASAQSGQINMTGVMGSVYLPIVLDNYSTISVYYCSYCPHEDDDGCNKFVVRIDGKDLFSEITDGKWTSREFSVASYTGAHTVYVGISGSGNFNFTLT